MSIIIKQPAFDCSGVKPEKPNFIRKIQDRIARRRSSDPVKKVAVYVDSIIGQYPHAAESILNCLDGDVKAALVTLRINRAEYRPGRRSARNR